MAGSIACGMYVVGVDPSGDVTVHVLDARSLRSAERLVGAP